MQKRWALIFAVLLFPVHAAAQMMRETPPPGPLQEQEDAENIGKAIDAIVNAIREGDNRYNTKKIQCMKAIGNTEFCGCVADNTFDGVTFLQYVMITTGTKEDFKYDQLSQKEKEIFDATRAVRDKCVNWEGKADKLKPTSQVP
jgi:hypothetical protein